MYSYIYIYIILKQIDPQVEPLTDMNELFLEA